MDVIARHFDPNGRPLLPVAALSEAYGLRKRTIYEWRRRGFLTVKGLDEDGQWLFDAGEVAGVMVTPRRRKQHHAVCSAA